MAGRKPETFTDKENAVLRAALSEWHEQKKADEKAAGRRWSQTDTGKLLNNIGQQSVGKLLSGGGFGRFTADALAGLCGYGEGGANALLRAHGAMADPMTVRHDGWQARDLAVRIAKQLRYEDEAIRRVVVKYQEGHYANRPARWWNDRIVAEATELRATLADAVDASPKTEPSRQPSSVPRRHRKAG